MRNLCHSLVSSPSFVTSERWFLFLATRKMTWSHNCKYRGMSLCRWQRKPERLGGAFPQATKKETETREQEWKKESWGVSGRERGADWMWKPGAGERPLKEEACQRGRQQTGKPGYRKYVRIWGDLTRLDTKKWSAWAKATSKPKLRNTAGSGGNVDQDSQTFNRIRSRSKNGWWLGRSSRPAEAVGRGCVLAGWDLRFLTGLYESVCSTLVHPSLLWDNWETCWRKTESGRGRERIPRGGITWGPHRSCWKTKAPALSWWPAPWGQGGVQRQFLKPPYKMLDDSPPSSEWGKSRAQPAGKNSG